MIRLLAILACVALFVADYALDVMAKEPPFWAYGLPILLALGVEINAIRRLAVRAIEVLARLPKDDANQE